MHRGLLRGRATVPKIPRVRKIAARGIVVERVNVLHVGCIEVCIASGGNGDRDAPAECIEAARCSVGNYIAHIVSSGSSIGMRNYTLGRSAPISETP